MHRIKIPALISNSDDMIFLLDLATLFKEDFSIDWIIELTGLKSLQVLTALENFVKKGWLKRKNPGIYCYSKEKKRMHNLTPEQERECHQNISKVIISTPIDDEDKATIVSYHLLQIQNDIRGCKWLKKAGDIFLKTFQTEQALKCYRKILDDMSDNNHSSEEGGILFIETALQYSKISGALQETSQVLSLLHIAFEVATKYNQPAYQALLKMNLAKNEWYQGRDKVAFSHFNEGRKITDAIDDILILQRINKFDIFFNFWQGRFEEVIGCYEKFVPEVTRYPKDRIPLWGVLVAGFCYAHTGKFSEGLGLLDAVRRHTNEIGDRHMETVAISTIGMVMLDIKKRDEALHHLEYGLKLAKEVNNVWSEIICRVSLALCYFHIGDNQKCISCLNEFIRLSSNSQMNAWPYPYFMELCWITEQGQLPALVGISLKDEIAKATRTNNVFVQGFAYRYKALLERKEDVRSEQIFNSLNLSLKLLKDSGSQLETAKTKLEIARQYLLCGDVEGAKEFGRSASNILVPLNYLLIPDDLQSFCGKMSSSDNILKEIMKLGLEMVNIRTTRELLLQIISTVDRLTGAERGAIFLGDTYNLELKASRNITPEQISHPSFNTSRSIINEVARTATGYIKTSEDASSNEKSIRSIICVPMILRNQVKGVLYHDNQLLYNAFEASDLDLLAYFAAQAAIAIDNVKAFEALQLLNEKLSEEKTYLEESYRNSAFVSSIIGNSNKTKKLLTDIQQAAQTDASVLILGETGVGKELVASSIHNNSPRKDKPFICVQCSALPVELLPSELFGHEKGSFTGALKRRIGRFELADQGTLFLDEIGDLKPDMQVHLLRVLQSKQFQRIGGGDTICSDFRLITATNRDLQDEVMNGNFRMDLYYRLNVFPVYVPPLRERQEDILLLVNHFIKMYSQKAGKVFKDVSRKDIEDFFNYDWPGNIRELENIIERAVILSRAPYLNISISLDHKFTNLDDRDMTLSNNERLHLIRALQKTNWKVRGKGGAAELLNINPSTLAFRMKKHGIRRPE